MRVSVPCLALKGQDSYFRMPVPKDLKKATGLNELKLSLRNAPLPQAAKACIFLRHSLKSMFDFVRRGDMDAKDLRPFVNNYYKDLFRSMRNRYLTDFKSDGEIGGELDLALSEERRKLADGIADISAEAAGRDF